MKPLGAIFAARFFIRKHREYMNQPEDSHEHEIGTRGRPIG